MRIGILTAVHGRHELAEIVLRHNRHAAVLAGLDVTPLAVLSEEEELRCEDVAYITDAGWDFIIKPNQPLSDKWNAGLQELRGKGLDVVICIGSDDLVHSSVFRALAEALQTAWIDPTTMTCIDGTPDWVGLRDMYSLHAPSGKVRYFPGYVGEREGEPIGTCRAFSRRFLDRVQWQLWKPGLARGLDASTPLSSGKGTILDAESAGPVVAVKAYPGIDLGSFWTMPGKDADLNVAETFGARIAMDLRVAMGPLARAVRRFDPDVEEPFISACMMVRNEEATISEALASLEGVADEVTVLDTGSTDSTREIAERSGCRVESVDAGTPFDFGNYRNRSIRLGRGKWILILDGKDQLANGQHLPQLLRDVPDEINTIGIMHRQVGGAPVIEHGPIWRLLRGDDVRSGKLHYMYPAHHMLVGRSEKFAVLPDAIHTIKPWTPDRAANRLEILERMLVQSSAPDLVGANGRALGGRKNERHHALYYLARTHGGIGGSLKEGSPEFIKEWKKAATYVGTLVDEDPSHIGAWLLLLTATERVATLEHVLVLLPRALHLHPRCRDLHWWAIRCHAAVLAVLASQQNQYPLVPSREAYYLPKLASIGPFCMMRFFAQEDVPTVATGASPAPASDPGADG